jgi:hypothetical protein
MVVVAMFNLVLLLLNFFIGLRTENKAAATSSPFSPGEAESETEERNATAAAASQAETWHRSEPVPVFGQLGETTQRG